jgi:hypothetical protein
MDLYKTNDCVLDYMSANAQLYTGVSSTQKRAYSEETLTSRSQQNLLQSGLTNDLARHTKKLS